MLRTEAREPRSPWSTRRAASSTPGRSSGSASDCRYGLLVRAGRPWIPTGRGRASGRGSSFIDRIVSVRERHALVVSADTKGDHPRNRKSRPGPRSRRGQVAIGAVPSRWMIRPAQERARFVTSVALIAALAESAARSRRGTQSPGTPRRRDRAVRSDECLYPIGFARASGDRCLLQRRHGVREDADPLATGDSARVSRARIRGM